MEGRVFNLDGDMNAEYALFFILLDILVWGTNIMVL